MLRLSFAFCAFLFASSVFADDMTGVPECDHYITKYESCMMSKAMMTGSTRDAKTLFKMFKQSMLDMAKTPEGRAKMPALCKTQMEDAKIQMARIGCTFD